MAAVDLRGYWTCRSCRRGTRWSASGRRFSRSRWRSQDSASFWQLYKTKSAALAAKESAEQARSRVRQINLVSLLPQLHQIESEIQRAVRSGSEEILIYWLSAWRWQASETRSYLDEKRVPEKRLMRELQASIAAAADVHVFLAREGGGDGLADVTAILHRSIAKVTGQLGGLSATRGSGNGERNAAAE